MPVWLLSIVIWIVSGTAFAAEVYEWRDAEGTEHMSDEPPPPGQPGVVLLRVDGKDVNVFNDGVDQAAVAAAAPAPARESENLQYGEVPRTEQDCEQIHGRPCNWADQWSGYAYANCQRVGDDHCDNNEYLHHYYDPRTHAQNHAEARRSR